MSGEKKSDFECFAKLSYSLYALNGCDRENFDSLLRTVYDFPKGKEVMNDVAFKGYKFMYDQMFNVNGACDYDFKTVRLNSFYRQTDLAPILVHECTHVRQVDRLAENTGVEKVGDFINGLNAYDFIKLILMQLNNNADKPKNQTISGEQIAALCVNNGKSYISAAFLDKAENMAVSQQGKEKLAKTDDKSVSRLPVRGEKKENASSAVMLKAAKMAAGR